MTQDCEVVQAGATYAEMKAAAKADPGKEWLEGKPGFPFTLRPILLGAWQLSLAGGWECCWAF